MDLRSRMSADLKEAMKARDEIRVATLRLINAALRDRDIALRGAGEDRALTEAEIMGILSRLVRMREESAHAYEEAGRLDLAERERAEIAVINEYLPKPMEEPEIAQAIDSAIAALGARSIRDMGRVMAYLREHYPGRMDFARIGPQVKARLTGG